MNRIKEDPPAGILENDPNVPELAGSEEELLDSLESEEGEELHFRAEGVARIQNEETGQWGSTDLYFKPHYNTVHVFYTVYMDKNDQ